MFLHAVGFGIVTAAVMALAAAGFTVQKAGLRYQGLVGYYGMEGLKKYIAAREWWRSPLAS